MVGWFYGVTLGRMRVATAGAHGQIGMRLVRRLVAGGDEVIGLIRNPEHAADLEAIGARAVVCDLEHADLEDVAAAVAHADAVVFAAGAGPGSGAARKLSMDRDGAIKLLHASPGVRYVMVSSIGADDPPDGDDAFSVYLRAKAEADAAVMADDREWTIIRPGALTDDPGTGRVRIDTTSFRAEVARDDVADVLEAVLHEPRAAGRVLYVNAGEAPLAQALAAALNR
jgi:nucleoside-diphosphate-sugar epimerase